MLFRKIGIVGAGQIGTSLAIAAAVAHPQMHIVAYDEAPIETLFVEALRAAGVALSTVQFTGKAADLRGCEMLILATPVSAVTEAIAALAQYVSPATLFTDVGSVKGLSKARIRAALDAYVGLQTPYVPFHILNGNAGSGPASAGASIFKAPGVLIPGDAPAHEESLVVNFFTSLGTTIHKMSADTHDRIFGTASHLEHLIMIALMRTQFVGNILHTSDSVDLGNWMQAMTRIAVAGPVMWLGNFRDNREHLLDTATHFRALFVEAYVTTTTAAHDVPELVDTLHQYAKNKRSARITEIDPELLETEGTCTAAFLGLLSLGITANVKRVEELSGVCIAEIANPSLKDGLGPVAVDPRAVDLLLMKLCEDLSPLVEQFLASFDQALALIAAEDSANILKLVEEASARRVLLAAAYD